MMFQSEKSIRGLGMAGDWQTAPLSELCEQIADCPHSTPLWTNSGVIVLRNQNIRNGRLDLSSPSFTDEAHFEQRSRRARLKAGDLVLTREAPMGEVCLIPEGLRCCLGQRMVMLRPDHKKCDSRFLLYSIQSDVVQHEIKVNEGTGSTVSNLRIPLLEALPIFYPSLTEQKAIAAVLGALDDKIELNRRMNATLEAMARALFQSWFVDFDPVRAKLDGRKPVGMDEATAALFPAHFDHKAEGAVPTGWNLKRWGDIATLEYGKSIRDYRESSGKYRVFGTNGPIGFHDEALSDSAGIVIGRKGAYRGVHYSPEPFFVIDTAFYLKPKAGLDLKWAYYELLRFDINSMDSGSAIPSTSRDDFYGIPVIVPPTEIQDAFGKIVGGWFTKVFANDHESRTLATLRDTMLPKLLSGELSVENL